jgi:hypothetical protein
VQILCRASKSSPPGPLPRKSWANQSRELKIGLDSIFKSGASVMSTYTALSFHVEDSTAGVT